MIAKETLEQVFQTTFISAKDNWKARCPYHEEKTPSFYVHKYDFIANCFGCGVSGSLDLLVADFLGITQGAARDRLGYTVSDRLQRAARRQSERTQTVQIFPESWLAPWKKEVHKSVIDRGFSLEVLKQAQSCYDPSTKRQVFPHRDREGRLLGAIGRTCNGHPDKWFFYWGYDKGQALYRPVIQNDQSEELIVVEGVFDALWFQQHGYDNVAAILGSKATVEQILEIKQSATSVLLCLDNDKAGREGSRRLYKALRKSLPIRVGTFPAFAKDPCDLTGEQLDECVNMGSTAGQLRLRNQAKWLFEEDRRRGHSNGRRRRVLNS